jgi:3-deoxy-D-manno-octulosonate 8-phosphate phosphatase (KDO 8-P phosphatase)
MADSTPEDLVTRARAVRWVVLDVDGVLTDGTLLYGPEGEALKGFHVKDGLGLRLAREAQLGLAVITARRSAMVERRARELGIEEIAMGAEEKLQTLERLAARRGFELSQVAAIGDDLPDLPVLRQASLAYAPADAAAEVREAAHVVLRSSGGRGAVREMVEHLLRLRGEWSSLVARLFLG